MQNLNEIINKHGNPDILIDSWENKYEGYAIWSSNETILWDYNGLFYSGKKTNANLDEFQKIINKWKKNSKGIPAVGFISYNFKNILYPNIHFKNLNKKFPYLFFIKPKKTIKYKIEKINTKKTEIHLLKELIDYKKYQKKINEIKNELYNGNAYQINYSIKKIYKCFDSGFNTYLSLREFVEPPHGFYIKFKNYEILSFSPELFFETKNNTIYSYPMKGTRGRDANKEKDNQLKLELKNSSKDKAEHLMIVDLLRNDIGKISTYGDVKVKNMFQIKSFKTVHQMITCVKGKLKKDINEADIFSALFPGGSITGAPKESAMRIIDKLENYSRDLYTGSIGYINEKGNLKFNIAIRTMTLKNNEGIYPVGGGIVWDSQSKEEWQETKTKSKILTQT
jgi:para-aminobenzoate synthetase/4-amino-4-deoxychorismate lyase